MVSGGKAAQVLVVAVVWGPHCGHMHILHCLLLPRQDQISLCKPPAYLAVAQLVRDTLAHVCVGGGAAAAGSRSPLIGRRVPGGSVQRAVKQALIGDGGSSNSRSGGSRDGSRDGQEDGHGHGVGSG